MSTSGSDGIFGAQKEKVIFSSVKATINLKIKHFIHFAMLRYGVEVNMAWDNPFDMTSSWLWMYVIKCYLSNDWCIGFSLHLVC